MGVENEAVDGPEFDALKCWTLRDFSCRHRADRFLPLPRYQLPKSFVNSQQQKRTEHDTRELPAAAGSNRARRSVPSLMQGRSLHLLNIRREIQSSTEKEASCRLLVKSVEGRG